MRYSFHIPRSLSNALQLLCAPDLSSPQTCWAASVPADSALAFSSPPPSYPPPLGLSPVFALLAPSHKLYNQSPLHPYAYSLRAPPFYQDSADSTFDPPPYDQSDLDLNSPTLSSQAHLDFGGDTDIVLLTQPHGEILPVLRYCPPSRAKRALST